MLIGTRKRLLLWTGFGVVALVIAGAVAWLPLSNSLRGCHSAKVCAFADTVVVDGFEKVGEDSIGRGIDAHYVGPPGRDLATLVTAAGLTTHPPARPFGAPDERLVSEGESGNGRWTDCNVSVYQLTDIFRHSVTLDKATADQISAGEKILLRVSINCEPAP